MQVLCITALLLSVVAAQPNSWRPWQDEKFPPSGRPELDADSELVTLGPEDGDEGESGDWSEEDSGPPVWIDKMAPGLINRPTKGPGKGNPHGPKRWTESQPETTAPVRSKRQAPGSSTDQPDVPRPGPNRRPGKPRGPPHGKWPGVKGKMVFSPVFKVKNVTFQNATDVPLKEGENMFLMPKHGGRGPHQHKSGKHGPPVNGQYVKLVYNSTAPDKVFFEYGVFNHMNLAAMVGEEDDPAEGV